MYSSSSPAATVQLAGVPVVSLVKGYRPTNSSLSTSITALYCDCGSRNTGDALGSTLYLILWYILVVQACVEVLMLLLVRCQVHLARHVVRSVPVFPPDQDSRRRFRCEEVGLQGVVGLAHLVLAPCLRLCHWSARAEHCQCAPVPLLPLLHQGGTALVPFLLVLLV